MSWLGPSAPIRTVTESATFHQSVCDDSVELPSPRLSVTHKARAGQMLNDSLKRSSKEEGPMARI